MSLIREVDLKLLGDERGSLVALESNKNIPFDIKRVYYIFGTQKGVSRGFHAHRSLEQIAICISGSCRMLMDDGRTKESVLLNCRNKGIYIDSMIWHEMHDFSDDCVLLVLASDYYDELDYIRAYNDFIHCLEC
jgi:dTDP-4-dehydrorhamnose 3,5-epimerase-like enzyme